MHSEIIICTMHRFGNGGFRKSIIISLWKYSLARWLLYVILLLYNYKTLIQFMNDNIVIMMCMVIFHYNNKVKSFKVRGSSSCTQERANTGGPVSDWNVGGRHRRVWRRSPSPRLGKWREENDFVTYEPGLWRMSGCLSSAWLIRGKYTVCICT